MILDAFSLKVCAQAENGRLPGIARPKRLPIQKTKLASASIHAPEKWRTLSIAIYRSLQGARATEREKQPTPLDIRTGGLMSARAHQTCRGKASDKFVRNDANEDDSTDNCEF